MHLHARGTQKQNDVSALLLTRGVEDADDGHEQRSFPLRLAQRHGAIGQEQERDEEGEVGEEV